MHRRHPSLHALSVPVWSTATRATPPLCEHYSGAYSLIAQVHRVLLELSRKSVVDRGAREEAGSRAEEETSHFGVEWWSSERMIAIDRRSLEMMRGRRPGGRTSEAGLSEVAWLDLIPLRPVSKAEGRAVVEDQQKVGFIT